MNVIREVERISDMSWTSKRQDEAMEHVEHFRKFPSENPATLRYLSDALVYIEYLWRRLQCAREAHHQIRDTVGGIQKRAKRLIEERDEARLENNRLNRVVCRLQEGKEG